MPVGKTIALLAEEGDDISNLEVPADEPASAPQQQSPPPPQASSSSPAPPPAQASTSPAPQSHSHIPKTDRPLFPSVLRLVQEHGLSEGDIAKIAGTGVRGMLTKGDVLAHLGLASAPTGTYREAPPADFKPSAKAGSAAAAPAPVVLDGASLRRLIVGNMLDASVKARAAAGELFSAFSSGHRLNPCVVPKSPADFDSIIADYLPELKPRPSVPTPEAVAPKPKTTNFLDGLV